LAEVLVERFELSVLVELFELSATVAKPDAASRVPVAAVVVFVVFVVVGL